MMTSLLGSIHHFLRMTAIVVLQLYVYRLTIETIVSHASRMSPHLSIRAGKWESTHSVQFGHLKGKHEYMATISAILDGD